MYMYVYMRAVWGRRILAQSVFINVTYLWRTPPLLLSHFTGLDLSQHTIWLRPGQRDDKRELIEARVIWITRGSLTTSPYIVSNQINKEPGSLTIVYYIKVRFHVAQTFFYPKWHARSATTSHVMARLGFHFLSHVLAGCYGDRARHVRMWVDLICPGLGSEPIHNPADCKERVAYYMCGGLKDVVLCSHTAYFTVHNYIVHQ